MKRKPSKKRCRKVVYHSAEDARAALKEFGRARGCKRIYHCQRHNRPVWHLTSQDKPGST